LSTTEDAAALEAGEVTCASDTEEGAAEEEAEEPPQPDRTAADRTAAVAKAIRFLRFIIKNSFFCSKHSPPCQKGPGGRADYCYLTITACKMQREEHGSGRF